VRVLTRALALAALIATAASAQAASKAPPRSAAPAAEDVDISNMDLETALPAIRLLLNDPSAKVDPEMRSILHEILPLGEAALNGTLTPEQANSGRLETLLERMVERAKIDTTTMRVLQDNARKAAAARTTTKP
jgi:hypothetical protein